MRGPDGSGRFSLLLLRDLQAAAEQKGAAVWCCVNVREKCWGVTGQSRGLLCESGA